MRTSETAYRHVSGLLPGTVMVLALLLSGCGEPADPLGDGDPGSGGPGSSTDDDGRGDPRGPGGSGDFGSPAEPADTEGTGEPQPVEFEWGLPPSDTSVGETHQGVEGSAYLALQRSCAEGAEFLSGDFAPTYGFESPRNVLLFAAGVRLCEGDSGGARALFAHAEPYGTAGLAPDDWAFCVLYQVVRSVLEQRPASDFRCGDGMAPPFVTRESATGEPRTDDPLTLGVDESALEPDADTDGDSGTGAEDDGAEQGAGGGDETGGEEGTDAGDGPVDPGSDDGTGGGPDTGTGPERTETDTETATETGTDTETETDTDTDTDTQPVP